VTIGVSKCCSNFRTRKLSSYRPPSSLADYGKKVNVGEAWREGEQRTGRGMNTGSILFARETVLLKVERNLQFACGSKCTRNITQHTLPEERRTFIPLCKRQWTQFPCKWRGKVLNESSDINSGPRGRCSLHKGKSKSKNLIRKATGKTIGSTGEDNKFVTD
jgi:hypothetical protein